MVSGGGGSWSNCHLLPLVLLRYLSFFLVSIISCHGSLYILFVPTGSPLQVHQQFQLLPCPLTAIHHVHVGSLAGTLGSKAQVFGSEIPRCIKGLLLPNTILGPLCSALWSSTRTVSQGQLLAPLRCSLTFEL